MRLIDADELINDIKEEIRTSNEQYTKIILSLLIGIIASQPTAYNPDKVVEELEENSSNYKKSYKANGKHTHKTIKAISQIKAIGIVRKGGAE